MNAKETVIQFLREMTEWELNYHESGRLPAYRAGDAEVVKAVMREFSEKSTIILAKYLTQSHIANLGLGTPVRGKPPIHLQDVAPDFDESKTKAVVFVSKGAGGMPADHGRYTLKKMDGNWLIDQLHYSFDGVKWAKAKGI